MYFKRMRLEQNIEHYNVTVNRVCEKTSLNWRTNDRIKLASTRSCSEVCQVDMFWRVDKIDESCFGGSSEPARFWYPTNTNK